MAIDLQLAPIYGPRFFRAAINDGDSYDFFEHRIDSRNGVGPRIATKQDKQNHPKLWAKYQEALTAELNAQIIGNVAVPTVAKATPAKAVVKKKGK